ncbi:MAG: hypothetical protein EP329_17965 [Deltaproteobacteria bacterium]|nr:MAG: hypothetical protein EP329_17965 [Deltaproteobacteria bacterium]
MSRRALRALAAAAALSVAAPVSAANPAPPKHAPSPAPVDPDGLSGVLRGVPTLVHRSPDAVADAWDAVKQLGSPQAQLAALAKQGLVHTVCDGLVDLRAAVLARHATFGFRDNVRGRSWGRPSLVHLLLEAMRRFNADRPGKTVAIGDVSQPGCGQVNHGTLVHLLTGDAAVRLVNRARVTLGHPTVVDLESPRAFGGEADRFAPGDRIEVERIIVGQDRDADGALTLRVETRRRRWAGTLTKDDLADLTDIVRRTATRAHEIDARRTVTVGADGMPAERWVTHYVDPAKRRQLVAVTASRVRRRLALDDALELRLSDWSPKKPESYRGETRYRPVAFPGTPPRWDRWRQLYEAGHLSHHNGRDVDLSYVTRDNRSHFAIDVDAMDVAATWRWFELLVEVGDELKTPVEMILVDPKIKRHLAANLPASAKTTDLWRRVIRLASGHDGHHHLRIAAADARTEDRARRALAAASKP